MADDVLTIGGETAAEIADSIRALIDRGDLTPGAALPSVRALADLVGVNRNTVVAAYRLLATAGAVETAGRAGTRVAPRSDPAQEGFAADTVLRDIGTGNPDPALIPNPSHALSSLAGRPVLYGEPTIDPDLIEDDTFEHYDEHAADIRAWHERVTSEDEPFITQRGTQHGHDKSSLSIRGRKPLPRLRQHG